MIEVKRAWVWHKLDKLVRIVFNDDYRIPLPAAMRCYFLSHRCRTSSWPLAVVFAVCSRAMTVFATTGSLPCVRPELWTSEQHWCHSCPTRMKFCPSGVTILYYSRMSEFSRIEKNHEFHVLWYGFYFTKVRNALLNIKDRLAKRSCVIQITEQ